MAAKAAIHANFIACSSCLEQLSASHSTAPFAADRVAWMAAFAAMTKKSVGSIR
jgi:hypothetical protein